MAPPRIVYVSNRRHPQEPGFLICRVTVDKVKLEFATGQRCHRAEWDAKAQQVRGKSREAALLNKRLTSIKNDLNALALEKDNAGVRYTAESLVREWQGGGSPQTTLVEAWQLFIEKRRPLIGVSISQAKLDADRVRLLHLARFLKGQKLTGLLPDDFRAGLADDFQLYLRTTAGMSQNYTGKIMQTVKQVLRWCIRHKYATRNPLDGYGLHFAPPAPAKYLTADELTRLREFTFSSPPLRAAADCFLFQCYTGLAYVDLARFRASQHTHLLHGEPWLKMGRQKTSRSSGQEATVPLLDVARQLLAHYGERLPVPTNQVYNRYLKEIAAVLGFTNLHLTSHVGRKTAGAQFLAAGVRMEVVSRILGHANIVITQRHYANVTNSIVADEFKRVYGKQAA